MENATHDLGDSNSQWVEMFPMRMTSIERLHWFDNDPELPNLVFCRIRIGEKVDESKARQAWQIVVARQPFADVKPEKINGRWNWDLGPRGKSENRSSFETWNGTRFEWSEYPEKPPEWRYVDHPLREVTGSYLGIRVWPKGCDTEDAPDSRSVSEIWSYVHHALGDGAGAIGVMTEWMEVYGNLMNGRPPETGLHRLDASLLKHRNRLDLLSWRYLKQIPKQPIALFGAAKFIFRKTSELKPDSPNSDRCDASYPKIIGEWISESQVAVLMQHAKSHGVMLNSVLLGQLYLTLVKWRAGLGVRSDRDWIRIILPMSIRTISDRRLPMANRATIVQIDRCEREMETLGPFYRSLDREIKIIRGWQLDKIFLLAVRCLSVFESLLRRAATNEKSRGMAVFTNLGDPLRKVGRGISQRSPSETAIRPDEFDFVGPVRAGTPVNFSVARYQSAMRVSLHFDPQVLTTEEAHELLAAYLHRLNEIGSS